ncbi:hypothetical protein ACFSL4_09440 [Streptomyces caeni]|uniref:Uncharacterized protein n=1 Tax=Streptomyces caeni TaxID=2307231 RepID=A0ABW4IN86_9ACTN
MPEPPARRAPALAVRGAPVRTVGEAGPYATPDLAGPVVSGG